MAQGIYYLESSDGTIIELDATTDINESYTSTVTSSPVDSGRTLTDHYYHNPTQIRFDGIVTNVYATDFTIEALNVGDKDPTLFRQKIRNVLDSKEPFTVFLFDISFKNYLITSISYDTNASLFGAYRVSMTMQQVELVQGAETIIVQLPPPEVKDPASNKGENDVGNTTEVNRTGLRELDVAGGNSLNKLFNSASQ